MRKTLQRFKNEEQFEELIITHNDAQAPILLTGINLNLSMDKKLFPLW